MENLHGHAAGNGGYGQGDTYGSDRPSPTRSAEKAGCMLSLQGVTIDRPGHAHILYI